MVSFASRNCVRLTRDERRDSLLFHQTRTPRATGKERHLGHATQRTLHADAAGAAVVENVRTSIEERTVR